MSLGEVTGARKLSAEKLRDTFAGCALGREIVVLDEITSTNDYLFGLAKAEVPEGFIVFAEQQTAGRGQYGKSWESAAGKGLWFSILLRPDVALDEAPRLTSWAAQSVATTLQRELSLGATVKLPNDVYVGERKVAGVLLEMRAVSGAPHLGILGIGINVNQSPEDFPAKLRTRAGSLAMATGHQIDREQIAIAVLRELNCTYSLALTS